MAQRKTYRIYLADGNQKLLEAGNALEVLKYLFYEAGYADDNIVKVEVAHEYNTQEVQ